MTLATHAVVGAAIANLMPTQPVLGFVAGFASHFILDSIPHWDYHLASSHNDEANPLNNDLVINRHFIGDLVKIACDGLLGLALVWLALSWHMLADRWFILYLGAIGGMLPDALQFAYMKIRREPLTSLQRFHMWIHTNVKLDQRPLIGIGSQIIIIIISLNLF